MWTDLIKQRLAVHLTVKQSSACVDRLIQRHSLKNKDSPLFNIFPFDDNKSSGSINSGEDPTFLRHRIEQLSWQGSTLLCVLYSIEGLLDERVGDSAIFVLDRTTRSEFQGHVALARPMTMILITTAIVVPTSSSSSTEHHSTDISSLIDMTRFDVSPSMATMASFKAGMSLLTRMSHSLERAKAILDALDRGSSSHAADAEGGLMDACAWIVDTVALVLQQFDELLAASEDPLHVVEAFMKRYTVLKLLQGTVVDPSGVFLRLEAYVRGAGDSSPAFLSFRQRMTELTVLAAEFRVEALWASVLAKTSLRLKLSASPKISQTLDGLTQIVTPLIQTLILVFAASTVSSGRDSSAWDTAVNLTTANGERRGSSNAPLAHTLRQLFVPLLARSLLVKCSEYVALNTMFSVDSVPDSDEQQGYIMPLCTRPAIAAKLPATAAFVSSVALQLQQHGVAYESLFPAPTYLPFRQQQPMMQVAPSLELPISLGAEATVFDEDGVPIRPGDVAHRALFEAAKRDVVGASLIYAADRCSDLVGFIRDIDNVGNGMMTKEVRCLCDTLHLAATTFPLMDGAHVKNWQRLADVFRKTMILKYVIVEPMNYESISIPPRVAAAAQPSSTSARSSADVTVVGGSDAVSSEELNILRSRVTILSAELKESRELLSRATTQLEQTQTGLQQAQDTNVVLMQELRRLMSVISQLTSQADGTSGGATQYGSYDKMIESLAVSELSSE
ncbi:Hypothetical protein, putative [Bodo saltans]|uniref:Uncharacterized protein n=1 Tax=Bodo saltans TaxID=75058 RepID=A0A0S4IIQ9_BODSA|nr:Hypothetical protein, putative [Bodo saltans]|eukprot:CUE72939.1 Hypothetical protein, putative [Bodo saltans]